MPDRSIEFESERQFHRLYGEDPENLLAVEKSLAVKVVARGNILQLEGEKVAVVGGKLVNRGYSGLTDV